MLEKQESKNRIKKRNETEKTKQKNLGLAITGSDDLNVFSEVVDANSNPIGDQLAVEESKPTGQTMSARMTASSDLH